MLSPLVTQLNGASLGTNAVTRNFLGHVTMRGWSDGVLGDVIRVRKMEPALSLDRVHRLPALQCSGLLYILHYLVRFVFLKAVSQRVIGDWLALPCSLCTRRSVSKKGGGANSLSKLRYQPSGRVDRTKVKDTSSGKWRSILQH